MNCPQCGHSLLFGTTTCPCGYQRDAGEGSAIDLSYAEALRAFWRVYWPVQLFAIAGYVPFLLWIRVAGRYFILRSSALPVEGLVLVQFVLSGVGLFLFVPRIASQPYQRFSIQVIDPDGNPTRKLSLRHRAHLWFFLWWRQLLAGVLAAVLAAPLNVLLSLIGLRVLLGLNVGLWVSHWLRFLLWDRF